MATADNSQGFKDNSITDTHALTPDPRSLPMFDFQLHTRVIFGEGAIGRLGELARELGFRRTLLVADRGLVESGHVDEAMIPLREAGVEVVPFHEFDVNPDTLMVEAGRDFARDADIDSIIGLGGGSSMDCAKGINFLLTNGGLMQDFWGYGKASKPMLPMIGIPTTAGTGSEAQCYALISDAKTHVKMACGDPKAAFRVALLDPRLTISQPQSVTATAGFDAIAHAVETFVTTRRSPVSDLFSREAWRLLESNYEIVLAEPQNIEARGAMQLGAYYAGVAIENSMLGATHACANPLTAHYGTTHGVAIAMLLPAVVRWNAGSVSDRYGELLASSGQSRTRKMAEGPRPADALARRLEEMAAAGRLPQSLSQEGIERNDLDALARDAANQWTGRFNPRPFDEAGALEVYESIF
ncbi:MAG TPA: iron-containing alcohol dehydrogenase [Blastocatellia bacterium]|nr:iron-containing alcohol dehydrogenase [Blastocatellia bacterium]